MKNKEHGITLVALVITIIILLILAGIGIQAITQNNLFEQAKKAKNATENSQKEENKTLSGYMDKINEYLPETLSYKVSNGEIAIGSYVNYELEDLSETELTKLKNNLNSYSGVANDENNAIKRDDLMKWRVLDIDEKTGEVRLISAKATDSKIKLNGYNGYNNAVKLIDDACSTLYNNAKLSSKVQNLKKEAVIKYLTKQPTKSTTEYKPAKINFPNILKQEENQTVEGSITSKIEVSEQKEFIIGKSLSSNNVLKSTYWGKTMNSDADFTSKIYYELFIKNNDKYYSIYWMTSRCANVASTYAAFDVCYISSEYVGADRLYDSNDNEYSHSYAFRPVINLKSNINLDETNPGEGTENNAYNIK